MAAPVELIDGAGFNSPERHRQVRCILWRANRFAHVARLPVAAHSVGRGHEPPGQVSERKSPPRLLVLWVLAGRMRQIVDGQTWVAEAGQVTWVLPGQVYEMDAVEECTYRWVNLDGPAIAAFSAGFAAPPGPFRGGACPLGQMRSLATALLTPGRGAELRALNLAIAIATASLIVTADPRREDLAERARAWIDRGCTNPELDINTLARRFACSRARLHAAFSAATGLSPGLYLAQVRIARAVTQLREPRVSLRVIALDCGFADPERFARTFRRLVGTTPSAYRRALASGLTTLG